MAFFGTVPAPSDRLASLRTELSGQGLYGFLVPLADEHQGEFIATRSQRLAWLTGFGGSAGMAIVMTDKAAIFVDGRYTLQVRDQVDTAAFVPEHLAESPPDKWLRANAPKGAKIGFDPWLHTPAGIDRLRKACKVAGAELVPVDANPVDAAWRDQPPPPLGPVIAYPEEFAGQGAADKRKRIADGLKEDGADAAVLSAPDSIAWLLNIRGSDVANTPLALSYAIVHRTGSVDWFVDGRKLPAATRDTLGTGVTVRDPAEFAAGLAALGNAGKTVRIDSATIPEAVRLRLSEAGADIAPGTDPCTLPKAKKNAAEIAGTRNAHIRDGAALTSFLAWLAAEAPKGGVTEISAAARLRAFRAPNALFRGLSFETISGSGPNGAIVHYRVTPETDRALKPGDVYLVDSGAQYLDGTTDVTRTVFIDDGKGAPAEARERFTRVLKGHIAVATARFPAGTHGSQIDALARLPLWEAGLDYDHGTGHGVGAHLGVHEGPQRISKLGGGVPMEPGMILSNEPGYYKEGAYGIRIENLVVVKEAENAPAQAERKMMDFETITLAPIDRALIDADLLTEHQRAWLNAYHARVRETLSPLVDDDVRVWLTEATAAV
ncbi:MAG: aminopeptidase P family protein [Alphaproteobacteria bacterium]